MRKAGHSQSSYTVVTVADLSNCLRLSRRSLGMSQDDLAEMLEVRQPRVARILNIFEILQVELEVFPKQDRQRGPPMLYRGWSTP